jgi:tetratricopeptide (TPR) repeat protein
MEFAAAKSDFDKALKSDTDPGTKYGVYVNRGVVRITAGDLGGGIIDLQEAAHLQPNRAAAYINLAQAFEKVGRAAKAKGATVPAQLLAPAMAEAEQLFWFLSAGEQLDLAIERDSHQPKLYQFRARLHRDCYNPKDGLRAIDTAIRLNRSNVAEDHAERGRILLDLRNYVEARDSFRWALKLRDARPKMQLDLAGVLLTLAESEPDGAIRRKQYEAAVEALDRYLGSPEGVEDCRSHGFRGVLHFKLGEYHEAIADFSFALKKIPDANLRTTRGRAYLAQRRLGQALLDFDEVLDKDKRNRDALLGKGLADVKRAANAKTAIRAVAQAEEAVEIGPCTTEVLVDAARVYAQALGRVNELKSVTRQQRNDWDQNARLRLKEAVLSVPKDRQWRFWQESVLPDAELKPLGQSLLDLEALLFPQARAGR